MSGEPSALTAGKGGAGEDAEALRRARQRGPAPLRIGVYGVLGRMGQMLVRCLLAPPASEPAPSRAVPDLLLTAALASSRCPHLGHDVGPLCGAAATGVDISGNLQAALPLCDVVIDFSTPAATELLAAAAAAARVPLVIGTTGLHPTALAAIGAAAAQIPIVRSANMSPGVNVLLGLLRRASRALPDYDAEIVELHHRQKRDAPSGTALLLAEAIKAGRQAPLELRSGREGQVGPRGAAELGVFAVRGGDVIGEHTALLLGSGERIELVHRATAREVFALGALRAARWLCGAATPGSAGQKAGLYDMEDVLGLT